MPGCALNNKPITAPPIGRGLASCGSGTNGVKDLLIRRPMNGHVLMLLDANRDKL